MPRIALTTLVVVALALAGCTGCSTTIAGLLEGPKPPDLSPIEPVTSRVGIGHVCPVGDNMALTAAHVESWRNYVFTSPLESIPVPLMGEMDGGPITLYRIWSDQRRDLSMVGLADGKKFPKYYPLAKELPKPGTRLWIRGFDVHKGFEGLAVAVEVMRLEFGHIYLKHRETGLQGSSGSCMLNDDEEVVGIYTAAYAKRDRDGDVEWMGDGELVAGPWGTYHESFIERSKGVFHVDQER